MIVSYQEKNEKVIQDGILIVDRIFDSAFYGSQLGGKHNGGKRQYVRHHSFLGVCPNRLFNPSFYRKQYLSDISEEPASHYLSSNGHNAPHILFDVSHFLSTRGSGFSEVTPLEEFLKQPFEDNISPTKYFDPIFYKSQNPIDIREDEPALLHYLRVGEKSGLLPFASFDPKEYQKPIKPQSWSPFAYNALTKLEYFALEQEDMLDSLGLNPLLKKAEYEVRRALASKLFDERYYLKHNSEARKSSNALDHYLQTGSKEGGYPHPLFNPTYYREKYCLTKNQEPLVHYLESKLDVQPHPLFDSNFYRAKLDDHGIDTGDQSLLEFFTLNGSQFSFSPCRDFDFHFYRKAYPYIKAKRLNPLIHYLKTGEKLWYSPSEFFFPQEIPRSDADGHRTETTVLERKCTGSLFNSYSHLPQFLHQIKRCPKDTKKILIVSHEATQTGAPLIILKLAKFLKEFYDLQPVIIVGSGGPLLKQFRLIGPTYNFSHWNTAVKNRTLSEAEIVASALSQFSFEGALMNSAESGLLIRSIKKVHPKIFFLIHEFGDMYPDNAFADISKYAKKVIAPCDMIADFAHRNTPFAPNKIKVQGQGLLNEKLLNLDKEKYQKKLKAALEIPDSAIVVLGCGTIEKRKGVDLFLATASKAIKSTELPLYFVWVGGVHARQAAQKKYFEWILKDVELMGLDERVLFIGEIPDTTNYFMGSDIMLLSSRRDPFPCVMHEAMAARLPVVCFDKSGGHAEVFSDGSGLVVPYGDTEQAATEIVNLAMKDNFRKNVAKRAYAKVMKQYNFQNYVSRLMDLFQRVQSNGKSTSSL